MDIGVLGVNYKSSDLAQREFFAKAAQDFLRRTSLRSLILLATCNRTEIYFSSSDLIQTYGLLLLELRKIGFSARDQMFYAYFGKQCFLHLAKVVSGMDSAIFGETEIQGQVKRAYQEALFIDALLAPMHYLFQKSLKIGKEMRSTFQLPKENRSLELSLWRLTRCFFTTKKKLRVLFVGCSDINRRVISFYKTQQNLELFLTTRNQDTKEVASLRHGLTLLPWNQLSSWGNYDVVISGSKSVDYLLRPEQLSQDFAQIQNRLVIDLGLPRNANPIVGKHPLITLFNIEEIGAFIEQENRISSQEQVLMQQSIEESVAWQMALYEQKRKKALLCV